MEIIGQRGEDKFLILTKDHGNPFKRKGKVLDTKRNILYVEMPLLSIIERGYWEEYEGSQDRLEELLKGVERQKL